MNIPSVCSSAQNSNSIFKTQLMHDFVKGATCGLVGCTIIDPIITHHRFPNMPAKQIFAHTGKVFGKVSLVLLGVSVAALLTDRILYSIFSK